MNETAVDFQLYTNPPGLEREYDRSGTTSNHSALVAQRFSETLEKAS